MCRQFRPSAVNFHVNLLVPRINRKPTIFAPLSKLINNDPICLVFQWKENTPPQITEQVVKGNVRQGGIPGACQSKHCSLEGSVREQ